MSKAVLLVKGPKRRAAQPTGQDALVTLSLSVTVGQKAVLRTLGQGSLCRGFDRLVSEWLLRNSGQRSVADQVSAS